MESVRRKPVYGLDLIRLSAAFLVMVYHFGFRAWASSENWLLHSMGRAPSLPAWSEFAWWGWIGVQIFFVVSGAVIAGSARRTSAARFVRHRIARLFPALLICASFALLVSVGLLGEDPVDAALLWLKTITFMPQGPWLLSQFWTIPIEVSFYAVVALLIALGKADNMEALAWALGGASAAYWFASSTDAIEAGDRWPALLLLHHGIYFALGILVARLGSSPVAPRHVVLGAICIFGAAEQIATVAAWELNAETSLWIVPFTVWLTATAAIAASFRWRDAIANRVERHAGALRLAGLTTYPLYLVHMHAGGPVLVWTEPLGPLTATVLAMAASLIAAFIITRYFELRLHVRVRDALDRVDSRHWHRIKAAFVR